MSTLAQPVFFLALFPALLFLVAVVSLIPSSALLTPQEAAEYLRTKDRTLERWRHTGGGPPFVKIGRRVCYKLTDLDTWLAHQRREHTSASAPPAA